MSVRPSKVALKVLKPELPTVFGAERFLLEIDLGKHEDVTDSARLGQL